MRRGHLRRRVEAEPRVLELARVLDDGFREKAAESEATVPGSDVEPLQLGGSGLEPAERDAAGGAPSTRARSSAPPGGA